MSEAVAQIMSQIDTQLTQLSQEEREQLAEAVRYSPENDPEFRAELERRLARIRSGEAVGIPAAEVLANWRKKS